MFLNPFILSGEFAGTDAGFFDFGAVFTATILATAFACFVMAFYGKTWPIGLAPGMGINAFVAFTIVAGLGYTPAEALGAVLSCWNIIFNCIVNSCSSLDNKFNSKKFKTWNWSWNWTFLSYYWPRNYGGTC